MPALPAPLLALLTLATPDADAAPATADGGAARAGTAPTTPGARAAARAEHTQAMEQLRAGNVAQAATLFAAAVEHDPGNAGYATDYGFALGRLGRRAEAEALLRAAIDKDPRRVYAWVNLAEIYADDPTRWERRDAIIAFLEKGLEATKEDQKRRFNLVLGLANFERAIGRTVAARARLKPLLAVDADPPLSRAQRKRVLDLLEALALDDRAHALDDWPRPEIARADTAQAAAAARALDTGHADDALALAEPLVQRYPTWPRALVLRARALEAAGRVDEAARDLEIAVNLAPSDAVAWRTLGKILAQHGGALEAERADDALRNALTLEPGWTDLRELRDKLARRRAVGHAPPVPGRATVPSDIARGLYQQAEEWIHVGDPVGLGRELLEQALADSPGFVAAAVSSYAISGKLPPATLEALKNDGPGLWALAAGVRKLGQTGKKPGSDDVEALVGPLIDRAVALDVQEARFARAIARAAAGDRAGAIADLTAYIAREPTPDHLAEARALRAEIEDRASPRGDSRPSPQLLARIRLLEDKPEAALRALGGPCTGEIPADRLVALGLVNEYANQLATARVCYELAAAAGGTAGASGLVRAANLYARLPDAELRKADRRTLAAAAARIGAAEWALARIAEADGDRMAALARTDRALVLAVGNTTDGDRWVSDARDGAQAPVGCAPGRCRHPPRSPPPVRAVGRHRDRGGPGSDGAPALGRAHGGRRAAPPAGAVPGRRPRRRRAAPRRAQAPRERARLARGGRRAARRDPAYDDGAATDLSGRRRDLRARGAGGGRPRQRAAGARARAGVRRPASRPRPRRVPARRRRDRRRRGARGDRRAPARSSRRGAGGVAPARTPYPPRRRDAVDLDRVGRGVGAPGGRRLDRPRPVARRPGGRVSRSSTTRSRRSS